MKQVVLRYAGALGALLVLVLFAVQTSAVATPASLAGDVPSPYDWYRYQGETQYGGDCMAGNANCGPAAVAMAIQYAEHTTVSVTEVRKVMGGACRDATSDDQIASALSNWSVEYNEISSFDSVLTALRNGHPVIAAINMRALSRGADWETKLSDPAKNTDLYKNPGIHWLVFKGTTGDGQWLSAYDPNVFDGNPVYFYSGMAPKGRDRLYRSTEVSSALLSSVSSFEITDDPEEANFTGVVTRAGQPAGNATVVFSDNRSRQPSITADREGRYSFGSFYPKDAIVAAVVGRQIGAVKAAVGQPQTIPLEASSNRIVLPQAGNLRVTFISTGSPGDQTACSGTFALAGEGVIFGDYLAFSGLNYDAPKRFSEGRELVFTLSPGDFCAGRTYESTDPARAAVAHPTETTWILSWEDWADGDFNDLTVRIDLLPKPLAYLQSPAAGVPGSYSAEGAAAGAALPPVEYYFDHMHPTDGVTIPDVYPYAVTFSGYDSVEPYFAYQAHQSYSGNDGTDFLLPAASPVFPTADGIVQYAGPSDAFCARQNARLPQLAVKVRHSDGYIAEYWGLASIAPEIVAGVLVTRESSAALGWSGANPCTGSSGFHFVLRNPSAFAVDPFGWNPRPNSHWYGVEDPWKTFVAGLQLDAASYALWDAPTPTPQLIAPNVDNVVASASGQIQVTVPAYASNAPLKILLEEGSSLPVLGPQPSYGAFSLDAFALGDQLVTTLGGSMEIAYKLPQDFAAAGQPLIYYWDASAEAGNKWVPLETVWDPSSNSLQAAASGFGSFVVGAPPWHQLFLPAISR